MKYLKKKEKKHIAEIISLGLSLININHFVKSVLIRTYSGPHCPAFELNTERYGVSLRIQSEWGKMRTRKTPNTDTFHAVNVISVTEKIVEDLIKVYFIGRKKIGIKFFVWLSENINWIKKH